MKTKALLLILAVSLFAFTACSFEEAEAPQSSSSSSVIITPIEENTQSSSQSSSETEQGGSSFSEGTSENSDSSESEQEQSSAPDEPLTPDESVLILVGPKNYIPDDYTVNLVKVQGKYNLDEKAAESAKELIAAANEAGFDMRICSAYRTKEKSAELFAKQVNKYINAGYSEEQAKIEAAKWVAPPGTSEHHTGLAMDIVSLDYWNYYSDLEHGYENFDSFKWMYENCADYGFILRFPKDKQDITGITYEPWHYRYVGKEAAKYIMENKICLEEYLEIIK